MSWLAHREGGAVQGQELTMIPLDQATLYIVMIRYGSRFDLRCPDDCRSQQEIHVTRLPRPNGEIE